VKHFGRTALSIGTQPAPEKQYAVLGNRAAATFAVALLGFGFWTVATAPSQKLHLPGTPALEKPISASTQYGTVTSQPHSLPGLLCTVGGVNICAKEFIFAHANSLVEYDLEPGKWKGLTFSMGIDDAGGKVGSVVYIVKGDGKVLFQSKVVRSSTSPPQPTAVNISGVKRLVLQVTDAGDGFGYDQAYWIEPRLQSLPPQKR